MIKNDKQNSLTNKNLIEFQEALKQLEEQNDIDKILKEIQINAVKSQIQEFKEDIEEYELLKKGDMKTIEVDSIESIQLALIKARIIKGWSHGKLADECELKEQQIQRYEATDYSTASIERISQIAEVLELDIKPFRIELPRSYNFSENIDKEKLTSLKRKMRENKSLIELSC